MSTLTQRKYAKLLGKLYYSQTQSSLVLVHGLVQRGRTWRYALYYLNPESNRTREIDAKGVEALIRQTRWITAAEYIRLREKGQALNQQENR